MPTQEMSVKDIPTQRDTLTIQEMARQSGLSEYTLRYYERIGLLTPIPRDRSSGHRRYHRDTVEVIESLACLRGTGMPLDDIRTFLRLRQRGSRAALEQKELFTAHLAVVTEEMEQIKVRMEYLANKVAYWEAVEAGRMDAAEKVKQANYLLLPKLRRSKETYWKKDNAADGE